MNPGDYYATWGGQEIGPFPSRVAAIRAAREKWPHEGFKTHYRAGRTVFDSWPHARAA